jgi:hypothetical protein
LLDALPTLPASGKVDRKALQRPVITPDEDRETVAPATPLEERLHAIWAEAFAPQRSPSSTICSRIWAGIR